jgi:CRP/FNR family transcriptional regulator, dissimilatory nitrate respiration regulator
MATHGPVAADMLASLPLFHHTSRTKLAALAKHAHTVQYPRGSLIASRGDPLPGLMAVVYGLVKLSLRGDSEKILRLVGPHECFGESVLFLQKPLHVEVVALVDTLIVVVPAAPLLTLFDTDTKFAHGLLGALCERLHALVSDFESATVSGALVRVAAYLDSLAEPGPDPVTVHLPAMKAVIAAHLGVTKETFSRLLHTLVQDRLVRVAKRDIVLLDRARLAELARHSPPPRIT